MGSLRVSRGLPELRLIVATMLRSIPSLANVVVLLGLILYVYAVVGCISSPASTRELGVTAPRGADPVRDPDARGLGRPHERVARGDRLGVDFYDVSFVVLAVFVVVNLFIAIVINNLEVAKRDEHVPATSQTGALAARLGGIRKELEAIESALRAAL